jgi:hypothetical protein
MTQSAEGQDRSSFQAIYSWSGLDFGFAKATNGLGLIDPTFAANWANIAKAGIPRGAYHELTATSSATAQAAFFVATVRGQGLRPGDMLAVVASDYAGVTADDVKTFCDTVARLVGLHNPVIVYTDLSVAADLGNCTGYPLWVSWPESTPPPSVHPWPAWHFWQWSWTPVDKDAFNGTPAALRVWLATYTGTQPPTTEEDDDMCMQLTGADNTIPAPWGTVQVRIGCSAPESLKLKATVGFLDHWGAAKAVPLAEGLGEQTIKLTSKQLRIVLPSNLDRAQYPVTITFDKTGS